MKKRWFGRRMIWSREKSQQFEFLRIFMLFFTFFIIFSVVSSVAYFSSNIRRVENLKVDTVSMLTRQVQRMDEYIQKVYTISYSFLSSEDTAAMLPVFGQENRQALKNTALVRGLSNLRASIFDHVYRVFLYAANSNLFYDGGMCEMEVYFNHLYVHERTDTAKWKEIAASGVHMMALPLDVVSEKYNAYSRRTVLPLVVSRYVGNRNWLLTTEVNAASVAEMLESARILEEQFFLCLDEAGNVFFNTLDYSFSEEELVSFLEFSRSSSVYIDEDYRLDAGGEKWFLTAQKGVGGLTYFVFTPYGAMMENAYQSNQFMLLFFLIAMLLFFLLTVIYARRLYHPLRSMAKLVSRLPSGLTDMQARRHGNSPLSHLGLKEMQAEQLDALYQETENALRESMAEGIAWLLNASASARETANFQRRFFRYIRRSHVREKDLCCLILRVTFQDRFYADFSQQEQQAVAKSMEGLLSEIISSGGVLSCFVTEYTEGEFACLFNQSVNSESALLRALKVMGDIFYYDDLACYCQVYGGLSSCRSGGNVDQLRQVLLEAKTALDLAYYEKKRETPAGMSQEALPLSLWINAGGAVEALRYDASVVHFISPFGSRERNQLLVLLKNRNSAALQNFAEELLSRCQTARLYDSVYRLTVQMLYDTGFDYAFGTASDDQKILPLLFSEDEEQGLTEPERVTAFLNRCAELREPEAPISLDNVFQYITNHFTEDIYLERIAEQTNLSAKYLSRSFKEKTGVNITDYIGLLRISKAKELLVQSAMSVGGVGEAVGFENRTTFFRTFKKLEGVSPNDYRKMNRHTPDSENRE